MILTIMLWLGMWGQAQVELVEGAVTQSQMAHCEPHDDTLYCYGLVSGVPDTPMTIGRPKEWQCKAAPAEHVFEIRTKTKRVMVLHAGEKCPEGSETRWLFQDVDAACVKVTRELWIDGHRVGTVLGLQ